MEISIKNPCHEKWEDMTPNEQGAFCGKCVKTVIDFSTKSLEEIKDFFSDKQGQKICGRFEEQQLTILSFDAFFEKFKRFEFSKRFAVILFFTFGFWLFNTSAALAQTNTETDTLTSTTPTSSLTSVKEFTTPATAVLIGKPITCNPNFQDITTMAGTVSMIQTTTFTVSPYVVLNAPTVNLLKPVTTAKKGKAVTPLKPAPVKPKKQLKTGQVTTMPPKQRK